MKASASFFGSFFVASKPFPPTTTAINSTYINNKSRQGPFIFCCNNHHPFWPPTIALSFTKTTRGAACGARRAFSSLFFDPAEEMKQPTLYEVLVRKLYMTNMFNPVKLGLKNIEQLHHLMNNPMDRVSSQDVLMC